MTFPVGTKLILVDNLNLLGARRVGDVATVVATPMTLLPDNVRVEWEDGIKTVNFVRRFQIYDPIKAELAALKTQIESLEERLYSTIKAGDRVIEYRGQFHGTVKAVVDGKAWVRSDNDIDLFSELHELRKEI